MGEAIPGSRPPDLAGSFACVRGKTCPIYPEIRGLNRISAQFFDLSVQMREF